MGRHPILVAEAYPALQERFILPHQPVGLSRALCSKKEMHRLAVEHGVPTPHASFPASIDDVYSFAANATFPVMVKGIFGNRLNERAGRTLFIAKRPEELVRLYRDLEDLATRTSCSRSTSLAATMPDGCSMATLTRTRSACSA